MIYKSLVPKSARNHFWFYHAYLFLIKTFLFKVLVVSVLNMAQLNIGLGLGFSSISVPDLELEESEIHFNKVEISWFGKNLINYKHWVVSKIKNSNSYEIKCISYCLKI